MALEVNEIGIRLEVRDREEEDEERIRPKRPREEDGCCGIDRDEIVEECVRRVLRMLKQARER